ncbi:PID-CTERM protein-sorting domain-containing protein [Rhodohalobacter sulfatireducens]|uniref:VPEID-CTERM sorting domain-containing protein n=1 Tax=Rhodohalobacter sulfatireducens TaxID=2911366 RepID=A0ABS9KHE9_9BACT|nr:hypothetical protein [Rhodohalobacter sulfatireducens]MCG2590268.1 hypothetical protein [Rhodohalobacter sulfatireducens]
MNNAFLWVIFISLIIISLIISVDVVYSQTPPPPPSKPAQNPIDGGLILLAGAGGAYAIHKLRDKKD